VPEFVKMEIRNSCTLSWNRLLFLIIIVFGPVFLTRAYLDYRNALRDVCRFVLERADKVGDPLDETLLDEAFDTCVERNAFPPGKAIQLPPK
jgi:hypothetical protein